MKENFNGGLLCAFILVVVSLVAGCGGDKDIALDKAYNKQQAKGSILDIVSSNPNLSTLTKALETSGLSEVLNDESSRYTLFAPSDQAFDLLGEASVLSLLDHPDQLEHILLYHVLPNSEVNAYNALQLAGKTTESANGIRLSLNRWAQEVFVNGVSVSTSDRKASNGVVHIIDQVLLPPNLEDRTVASVKQDIIDLAVSYKGLVDENFALQRNFEPLLAELLSLAPQTPVSERIDLVAQPWRQVWGPYSYGSGQSGVDPDVSVDEIYQVVFEEGFYYNVTPLIDDDSGAEKIGMLKGEFTFDADDDQCLQVQFVEFPGLASRPAYIELWDLPVLQEAGSLAQVLVDSPMIEIVPTWIVRSFFGGGQLCEVYTDETLRISISKEDDNPDFRKLYIMEKISF